MGTKRIWTGKPNICAGAVPSPPNINGGSIEMHPTSKTKKNFEAEVDHRWHAELSVVNRDSRLEKVADNIRALSL